MSAVRVFMPAVVAAISIDGEVSIISRTMFPARRLEVVFELSETWNGCSRLRMVAKMFGESAGAGRRSRCGGFRQLSGVSVTVTPTGRGDALNGR